MKTLRPKNYEEYSNQINWKDIGGSLDKEFIRVDSKFISNYFDEISKPNSSYVSYADDLIRECYDPKYRDENGDKNFPLKYFSALVKELSNHYSGPGSANEVVGSRLANLFGVPTVYNEQVIFKDEQSIISLDYLKMGETVCSLTDIYEERDPQGNLYEIINTYDGYQSMSAWCNFIYDLIGYKLNKNVSNRYEMIDDVIGDFCVQMLFKNLILNDEDFKAYNISLIFSDDNKSVKLAPAFDYEFCNFKSFELHAFLEYLFEYFALMNKCCPKKLASFMDRLNKVCFKNNGEFNPTRISKIFRDNYTADYIAKDYMKCLRRNIERIQFGYQTFKENPDKEFTEDDIKYLCNEFKYRDISMFIE